MKKLILISALTVIIGCAHVISQEVRNEVDPEVTPEMIFSSPDAYKGKSVILGGVIINSQNTQEGTSIEVLHRPTDYRGRPKNTDISLGRFLIFYEGYLDTAIYSVGRKVTVAGEVLGKRTRPLGKLEYPYVVIKSTELHLVKSQRDGGVGFSLGIFTTF
jgi:outer membrane lipoprotein